MASHFAADACKNGGLRAQAFNDASLLTCHRQRLAFEEVFALPLDRFARAGDMLITISSSGSSPNIVRALERARRQCGCRSSRCPAGSRTIRRGDSATSTSTSRAQRYGWIESGHHVVLHYWLDQYLNVHGQGAM